LEQAYVAAAEGKPLIQLSEAIRSAPRDAKGRPRLAIARADRRQVQFEVLGDGRRVQFDTRNPRYSTRGPTDLVVTVDYGLPMPPLRGAWEARGFALVPIVPPDVLEKVTPKNLNGYHILFEVEAWADSRIGARPDIDPYLMRHIGGDLWAIVAEWDLTDIERAVMAARARD
jgi:hypothetical protein